MAEGRYKTRRTNPRFSFFAEAEVTLRDGTGVRGQLAELSSRGCYIDTLEPIPLRTKLHLRICDGTNSCELHGKVLYMHSGGGFGIFGMGVLFEEMGTEQHSAINGWLRELAVRHGKDSGKNSVSQIRGETTLAEHAAPLTRHGVVESSSEILGHSETITSIRALQLGSS